ncbi:hypothetical protein CP960_13180 [Malaciobacter halophilus]|uniref:Uncharacterized protein n=1 Tax=Malaciobacter halophilus TaxID=197482 RepID=A0A2N1IZG0_9BACT|nr:hypothetical protein [Malaciobacter halophilus]AXH09735.1 hypothetical protein AHALO_1363 [Malaciobacter halophilus]AXH10065.1 hypothetical protein AHALO_1699 [Malaciobacter halophilus]PKI79688.1 hypothetical protein CP960_13180 [Malaciobacter halophilus]
MAKQFQITQRVVVNGENKSTSFRMYGENDDVTALGALLAGGYEVKEINDSLSDTTNIDQNNATTNPVTGIYLSGPKNQVASIRPYSGVIHFKNTANVDDIAAVLKTTKPFELLPNEVPTRVTVKRSESFSAQTQNP